MKQTALFVALLVMVLLTSCTDSTQKSKVGKNTDSAPWELLVVANKEWTKTNDGSVFMQVMNKEIPGLNQVESSFHVVNVNPNSFSKTFQGYANIVKADFGSKYTKASMSVAHDVYAHPQIIITLTAPNGRELAQYASDNSDKIISLLTEAELASVQIDLRKRYSSQVLSQAQKQFGISIFAPKEVKNITKVGENFFWASEEDNENRMNICMYTIDLTNSSPASLEAMRDSVMEINIRGYKDNQYMATVPGLTMIHSINVNGAVVTEARGLWEMKNDMMGGSYIMHVREDLIPGKLLVVEGFVYAPNKSKRLLIRQLEAALRTVRLSD
ncbi:MAG: DUF4837 family protein [Prevotellaceae bacterium]|nr:DUF4837 family protein [Candidatus Colivivens caballi]